MQDERFSNQCSMSISIVEDKLRFDIKLLCGQRIGTYCFLLKISEE